MKKIGIVTIQSQNYGNRLQNYALQEIIKSLGYQCETIRRTAHGNVLGELIEKAKRFAKLILGRKTGRFYRFDRNVDVSKHWATANESENGLANEFDCFICGSDQVWNPYYHFVGKSDLLSFARSEQKISYAASFGVNNIPDDKKEAFATLLNDFKNISVREEKGADIVEDLIGKKASVVLDPAMMLDEKAWKKVEKKPTCAPKNKYALVYALGEKSDLFKEKIESVKGDYEVFDIRSLQKNGKEIPVGPSEFLYLMRRAEIVLTDSFHASVFSILFNRKFYTFNRSGLNMNSRIVSLADICGINDNIDEQGYLDCSHDIDYKNVDARIEKEREKSINFLKNALEN